MKDTQTAPTRSRAPGQSPPPFYMRLLGRPALEVARRAECAAKRWRKQIAAQFGPRVPEREVEAFEAGHAAGQRHAHATEAFRTGFAAGAAERQRASVGGLGR